MRGSVIAVEGPSAAGKSRAVEGAARRLAAAPLAEAYVRLRPRPGLTWRSPGGLLALELRLLREEGRRFREARELADLGAWVLADTGFLGPLTYTRALVERGDAPVRVLERLVAEARHLADDGAWGLPDAYLYLRTPPRLRQRRAADDPAGHPAPLRARHEAVGTIEGAYYRSDVAPVYGARFRTVSGSGTPAAVADRVARAARRVVNLPPVRRPERVVLAAFGAMRSVS